MALLGVGRPNGLTRWTGAPTVLGYVSPDGGEPCIPSSSLEVPDGRVCRRRGSFGRAARDRKAKFGGRFPPLTFPVCWDPNGTPPREAIGSCAQRTLACWWRRSFRRPTSGSSPVPLLSFAGSEYRYGSDGFVGHVDLGPARSLEGTAIFLTTGTYTAEEGSPMTGGGALSLLGGGPRWESTKWLAFKDGRSEEDPGGEDPGFPAAHGSGALLLQPGGAHSVYGRGRREKPRCSSSASTSGEPRVAAPSTASSTCPGQLPTGRGPRSSLPACRAVRSRRPGGGRAVRRPAPIRRARATRCAAR